MSNPLSDFFNLLTFIIVVLLFLLGYLLVYLYTNRNKIESDYIITPEIKLTIKDNKVDTIYVYKLPKNK